MEIQTRNALGEGQRDSQLQLCVPLVAINGHSYRLKDRLNLVTRGDAVA
jgi:hypothetical protein